MTSTQLSKMTLWTHKEQKEETEKQQIRTKCRNKSLTAGIVTSILVKVTVHFIKVAFIDPCPWSECFLWLCLH